MVEDGKRVNYGILTPLERKPHHLPPQVKEPDRILEGEIVTEDKVLQGHFFERFHEEGRFIENDPQSILLMYEKLKLHGTSIVRVCVLWE